MYELKPNDVSNIIFAAEITRFKWTNYSQNQFQYLMSSEEMSSCYRTPTKNQGCVMCREYTHSIGEGGTLTGCPTKKCRGGEHSGRAHSTY